VTHRVEHPPETCGVRATGVVVRDHGGVIADARLRQRGGEHIRRRQGMPSGATAERRSGEVAIGIEQDGPEDVPGREGVGGRAGHPAAIGEHDGRIPEVRPEPVGRHEGTGQVHDLTISTAFTFPRLSGAGAHDLADSQDP